jgi:serine/threonine-protein phosphatase 2A regulatory subunit B''
VAAGALLQWASAHNVCAASEARRAFDILRQPNAQAVVPEDLRPLLAGILLSHPGLEFLQEAPEFQERYAETVIHRIFYHNNRLGDGRISWREFRRGDVLQALRDADEQEDINKVLRHFSYEHFYVVYCKFWDVDTDHDFRISRDDLLRYGNHSLTYRIVDRIFAQAGRPFHRSTTAPTAGGEGGLGGGNGAAGGSMSYEDFVYFILSEEDKSTDASLDYWFRCCDLDGDGRLTPDELLYFYEEQLHRMECLSQVCYVYAAFSLLWAFACLFY